MLLKFKEKGFIVIFIVIIGIAVISSQNQSVYAQDIKQDSLLLIKSFDEANIEVERMMMNYNGVIDSFKDASKVNSLKKEVEQAFSINLSPASEPDEKELIKYQGQKNIPFLQNTKIQVTLASVLHENGAYQAHLIISVLSNFTNTKDFDKSFSFLTRSLESISMEPKIKVNIQGSFNQKLSHETQQDMIMNMFANLGASVYEGLNEKEVISLTGYSKKLSYSLESNENPINVQIASRYDSLSGKTNFTIGTPLITTVY